MATGLSPYKTIRDYMLADPLAMWQRMDRLFNEEMGPLTTSAEESRLLGWRPTCDIFEKNGEIVVKVELPEVNTSDVHVSVEGNVLTIRGERKFEQETKREDYHRLERRYGEFLRRFMLPEAVDDAKVKAEFKDGILRVTLPKLSEAKAKEVKIQ